MSIPILKRTSCDGFCDFNEITTYCFDCPALLCRICNISMHDMDESQHHVTIEFQNATLNWDDKMAITSIFKDENLGETVYAEVSRKFNIFAKKEISHNKISQDETQCWICQTCTYKCNPRNTKKCEMCFTYRIIENIEIINEDYDKKVEIFLKDVQKCLVDLDQIHTNNPEISFENIMHCYIIRQRGDAKTFVDWYNHYYPKRKSLPILKNILEEKGYTIRMNELDRHYDDMIKEENKAFLRRIPNENIPEELLHQPELIEPNEVNLYNKLPNNILNTTVTEEEVWKVILSTAKYTESEIRMLLIELVLDSKSKIDVLYNYLHNKDLREYLEESSSNKTVTVRHLKQAISDLPSVDCAMNFLRKECEMCCSEYPMPEMCSFLTCEHEYCKSCTLEWLKETVQSKYPCRWYCPGCNPEQFLVIDKHLYYSQLRRILKDDRIILNIFEDKLLKEQLRSSPNFHWCANEKCENGFEAVGVTRIQCPTCHCDMCVKCNRSWVAEHEGKSCQEFELWILKNDPNLSKLLKNIGIECPVCGMRYALAAGGCLHFDCKACGTKFCGGCYQQFVDKCDKPNCVMTTFHGHHPRNCLYFLRDYDANQLENMLKAVDYPKLQGKPDKNCQLMITTDDLKDLPCNANAYGTTGMCDKHYKEYLVQFINRYQIDPVEFVSANELNQMLFQMVLPKLQLQLGENDEQFKERLKKEVKGKCLFYLPKGINDDQAVAN